MITGRQVRFTLGVLAVLVALNFATGAYADSFTFSYSGPQISGSGTLQATADGGGLYTLTSISGTQVLNGETQTILGLVSTSAANPYFYYDNQFDTAATPVVDPAGWLFNVTGESQPVNLCAGGSCVNPGAPVYAEDVYVGTGGDWYGSTAYSTYAITSFTSVDPPNSAPEPSSLFLLASGMLGLMGMGLLRKRFAQSRSKSW
jgi:PEP-CTERM motif